MVFLWCWPCRDDMVLQAGCEAGALLVSASCPGECTPGNAPSRLSVNRQGCGLHRVWPPTLPLSVFYEVLPLICELFVTPLYVMYQIVF